MQLSHYSSDAQPSVNWSAQLLHLVALLADDPQNPLAWRWRMRIKILRYLLSRYGHSPHLKKQNPVSHMRLWICEILFPTRGKAPRTRKSIRETLERIAKVNQEVRASIDRKQARW